MFDSEPGGDLAGENIRRFITAHRDQSIGTLDPGFFQNRNIRAAAADALNIKAFTQTLQLIVVGIQDNHIIILFTKSLCKQTSQLSGSNNDRFHLHAPCSATESIR